MKTTLRRRLADALVALVTWTAAAVGVLWFYDWVSRWYVVVAVLLVIVGTAMVTDKATLADKAQASPGAAEPAALAALPMPRDGELADGGDHADVAWPAPEQQIA